MVSNQPYSNYHEYLKHPRYLIVRAEAIKRAAGICEKCNERPVTEVHHLRYPKWGTFDTSDNLLAVCHQCHCKIHGKEN